MLFVPAAFTAFTGKDHWVDSTTQAPVSPSDPNAFHEFQGFTSHFKGASFSFGGTYNFKNNLYLKVNIAGVFENFTLDPSPVYHTAEGIAIRAKVIGFNKGRLEGFHHRVELNTSLCAVAA